MADYDNTRNNDLQERAQMIATDTDYIDGEIIEATYVVREEDSDSGWQIVFAEKPGADYEMGFYLSQPIDTSWKPETGEAIRVYGFGGGGSARGVFVEEVEIFYYTQEEWDTISQRRTLYRAIEKLDQRLYDSITGRNGNDNLNLVKWA